jgi:hypothetical protein
MNTCPLKPQPDDRLPYDLRLQIGKALDRLVCDESTPEQVDTFIETFAAFGLTVSAIIPSPALEANQQVIETLRAALQALLIQALQSELNTPANEWGWEAIGMARAALSDNPKGEGNAL